jgi:hypothetical protein
MNTTTHTLVQNLLNCCSLLRDHGMSYGDPLERLRG